MDFKDFLKLFEEWEEKKFSHVVPFPKLTIYSDCSGSIFINDEEKEFFFDNFDELN
jgi:hypothetical protein